MEQLANELNIDSQGPLSVHVRTSIRNNLLRHAQEIKDIMNEELQLGSLRIN